VKTSSPDNDSLLSINNLTISFTVEGKKLTAVENLSFSIGKGETIGVVGESGCGKSVTALSILGLNPSPPATIDAGSIRYQGQELIGLSDKQYSSIRGNSIAMIFQEPMTALNPVFTIGDQIGEVFQIHQGANKARARELAIEMMKKVGIPEPERRIDDYPHQFSGGMRQRAMIAMALACRPSVLIADEPTTALDVTIQAQILDLMQNLKQETGMSIIFITHDLGIVAEMCDKILVMYAGHAVEMAPTKIFFQKPLHPYTQGLLGSLITLTSKPGDALSTIKGDVPPLGQWPKGCHFASRCPYADEHCYNVVPVMRECGDQHQVACHKVEIAGVVPSRQERESQRQEACDKVEI
jgi:oligopeptide/dipeptide ABC transporter ATP-binding protein